MGLGLPELPISVATARTSLFIGILQTIYPKPHRMSTRERLTGMEPFSSVKKETQETNQTGGETGGARENRTLFETIRDWISDLEDSRLDRANSTVKKKNNDAKKGVVSMDYYLKDVVIDGKPFEVIINIRNKADGHFAYEVNLRPNKNRPSNGPQLTDIVGERRHADGQAVHLGHGQTIDGTGQNVNREYVDDYRPLPTAEARHDGASTRQQAAYGTANAAIEALTEKMFDGLGGVYGKGAADKAVDKVFGGLAKSGAGQNALRVLSSMGGEALEEAASGVADPALRTIYSGKQYGSLGEYLDDVDVPKLRYDMLLGGLLGGIGSAAQIGRGTDAAAKGNIAFTKPFSEMHAIQPSGNKSAYYLNYLQNGGQSGTISMENQIGGSSYDKRGKAEQSGAIGYLGTGEATSVGEKEGSRVQKELRRVQSQILCKHQNVM